MKKETTTQETKMRAVWFARTLHENKIRIQKGAPKMEQKDYDDAWEKVVKEFAFLLPRKLFIQTFRV